MFIYHMWLFAEVTRTIHDLPKWDRYVHMHDNNTYDNNMYDDAMSPL